MLASEVGVVERSSPPLLLVCASVTATAASAIIRAHCNPISPIRRNNRWFDLPIFPPPHLNFRTPRFGVFPPFVSRNFTDLAGFLLFLRFFFFVSWCSPLNLARSPTHSRYKLLSRANYASRTWLSSSESTLFCCFFGDGYAKGDDRPLLQHFSPSNSLVFITFASSPFLHFLLFFFLLFSSLHHTDQIDHI